MHASAVVRNTDCNEAAREVADMFFSGADRSRTLGLAFIDPTAFQIGLDAIRNMTAGHRIDVIVTVMTGYMKRFMRQPGFERPLDTYFGSESWKELVDPSAPEKVTSRALLDYYENGLRELGYVDLNDDVRIANSTQSTIYHLVFASKHKRGAEFWRKISRRKFSGQARMDLT